MLKGFVTVIEHNDGLTIQFLYIYEKTIKTKKYIVHLYYNSSIFYSSFTLLTCVLKILIFRRNNPLL